MSSNARVAIIVDPTKVDDLSDLRERFARLADQHHHQEPTFIETTEDDPGLGQARQAVADGHDLICSLGGDGTVRAVAGALTGSEVPLGLLPGGTGNLLARNLGLNVEDLDQAFVDALTGPIKRIDVGEVQVDDHDPEVFLVMVGMGLDAEMMAGASEKAKKVLGWLAYAGSGVRALFHKGFSITLAIESGGQRQVRRSQHARSVIIGNVGHLQGGFELLHEITPDDGQLDSLVLAPQGPVGWAAALINLLSRHRRGHSRVQEAMGTGFEVRAKRPVETQLDGDPIGGHLRLRCQIKPGALLVKGPPS